MSAALERSSIAPRSGRIAPLALTAALLSPIGCDATPTTQTLVHVDAGPMSRELGHRVVVRVYSGIDRAEVRHVQELRLRPDPEVAFPFVVPVVPTGRDHRRLFEVQVVLSNERGVAISERSVTTSFIEDTLAEVFISLDDPCLGVFSCEPGLTCVLGECRETYVPPVAASNAGTAPTTSALAGECIDDLCLETPRPVADDLFAVCLTSAEEAFAVGEGGVVVHLAADQLTAVSLRPGTLYDVACHAGGAVVAGASVATWNGVGFTPLPPPTTGRARAIAGSDPERPLLGMSDGRVLEWDGTAWTRYATLTGVVDDLEQVGESTYAAAGGALWRITSSVSTPVAGPAGETAIVELAAWESDLLVRTDAGRLYVGNGSGTWEPVEIGPDVRASAVAASGARAYAGTETGLVFQVARDGAVTPFPPSPHWGAAEVYGLAARDDIVLAVGPDGRIARFVGGRNAGGSEHLTFESIRAIAHAGGDAPVAVGASGTLLERDAEGRWSVRAVTSGAGEIVRVQLMDVYATDGLAVVVGYGGTLLERTGGAWTAIDVGGRWNLLEVDGRDTRVAVIGHGGTVLERQPDGSWLRTRIAPDLLHAVAVRTDGTPVVGNDRGEVFERVLDTWTLVGTPLPDPVRDLDVADDGRLWAVTLDSVYVWDGVSWTVAALPGIDTRALVYLQLGGDGEPAIVRYGYNESGGGQATLVERVGTTFVALPIPALSVSVGPGGEWLIGGHFGRIWRRR